MNKNEEYLDQLLATVTQQEKGVYSQSDEDNEVLDLDALDENADLKKTVSDENSIEIDLDEIDRKSEDNFKVKVEDELEHDIEENNQSKELITEEPIVDFSINGEEITDEASINGEEITDEASINGEEITDEASINEEEITDEALINEDEIIDETSINEVETIDNALTDEDELIDDVSVEEDETVDSDSLNDISDIDVDELLNAVSENDEIENFEDNSAIEIAENTSAEKLTDIDNNIDSISAPVMADFELDEKDVNSTMDDEELDEINSLLQSAEEEDNEDLINILKLPPHSELLHDDENNAEEDIFALVQDSQNKNADSQKDFDAKENEENDKENLEDKVEKVKKEKAKKEKVKKEKVKKEKVKKEKVKKEDSEGKEKKETLFSHFFKEMTEEDYEPEPDLEAIKAQKAEKQKAKEEAKTEKEKAKADAKAEKDKAKAEAKAKKAQADAAKKKEKLEKKQAKIAAQKELERGKKKKYISKKKVTLIAIFAASLLIVIIFSTNTISTKTYLNRARNAFYNGNYQEAFLDMYGEKLNDSDHIIYEKTKTILKLQRKIKSYENNLKLGNEKEALNALIEGVTYYEKVKEDAASQGVIDELDGIENEILGQLSTNYNLSREDAVELGQIQDDLTYTKTLNEIIMGNNVDFELLKDKVENTDSES